MTTRGPRRLALTALAALAAALVLLAAVVHLRPVRAMVLGRAAAFARDAGVELTADDLSYNLFALEFRLRNVRVRASGATEPFAAADFVRIDLPASIVRGRFGADAIEADGLAIRLVRDADGRLNLPASGEGEGAPIAQVPLGRVSVRRASISYTDAASDLSVTAGNVALELADQGNGVAAGTLSAGPGISIRAGTFAADATLDARISYDGSSATIEDLTSGSSLGRLRASGRVGLFGASPSMDLTVDGSALLGQLSAALALDPPLGGSLDLNVHATGPVSAPTAAIALSSGEMTWRHLTASNLTARGTATTDALSIESLALQSAGGSIAGRGDLRFDTMRAEGALDATGLAASALAGPDLVPPIGARLDATGTFSSDLDEGLPGLTLAARLRATPERARPSALALAGDLAIDTSGGDWRATIHQQLHDAITIDGTLSGRLAPVPADSTLSGVVTLVAASGADTLDLLRRAQIEVPDQLQVSSGRLEAEATLGGTFGAPAATGRATLRDLRVRDAAPLNADLSFAADPERIAIEDITASAGGNSIEGTGRLTASSGALQGRFDLSVTDWPALGSAVEQFMPAGELSAQIGVSGTRDRPDVRATIAGSALDVAGQRLGRLSAQLAYAGTTIVAESIRIEQPDGGFLQAAGRYTPASEALEVNIQAARARVEPIVLSDASWPIAAVVDGQFAASGRLPDADGRGHVTLTDVQWDEAGLDRADADLTLSRAGLRAAIAAPSIATELDTLVDLRAPYAFTATLRASDSRIETLVDALGSTAPPVLASLTGTVRATIDARGTLDDLAAVEAKVVAERLEIASGDARLQLERPATASYGASTLSVDNLRLRTGTSSLDANGTIAQSGSSALVVTLDGNLADLRAWLPLAELPSDVDMSGPITARVRAQGAMTRIALDADARISDGRVAWPGYPAATAITGDVVMRNGVVDLSSLRALVGDASVEARASFPLALVRDRLPDGVAAGVPAQDAPATIAARIAGITPALLAAFAGSDAPASLTANATLQADLRSTGLTLDDVSGSLTLTELRGSSSGMPIEQVRPTRIDIASGSLQVTDWTWTVAGSPLAVAGRAELSERGALDLLVDGRVDLRMLGMFAPGFTTAGTGDVSVALRGTVDAPVADGTVRLSDVEVQMADPRMGLTSGRGLLTLTPNRIDVTRIEASLNGGLVTVAGGIEYTGTALTGGALSIDADGVALDVPAGLRTEIDAALTARIAERIQIDGRVDIVQGAYREPISLAATAAAMARQREASRAQAAAPGIASQVDLNITVASATDLQVDNNYGRMDLGVDVRLTGTAAAPSVVGRASIRDGGLLYLGGQTYVVERGTIDFSDPRAIVPDLDLAARTRVNGVDDTGAATEYDITLAVSGTPDALETTLTSDPARSQADVVSLLATGRLADQVGGMSGTLARDQLLGYLSGEALGFAARAVGLDSIRLERRAGQELSMQTDPSIAGEVNPAQRLTIARRISGGVEVTLSQNLRDTGRQTWVVSYKPVRPVEIRGISRDDRSRSYELRHDVALGGPRPEAVQRVAVVQPRVAEVRFAGDTSFPVAQLEGMTSLDAGDRFDFRAWQRDRDRLRNFYLERDHREVRISARQLRQPGDRGEPTIVLEYGIDAGPRTLLDVEGYRLAADDIRTLNDVWSNTIVDVALPGELEAATRRILAGDGYFNADVQVDRVIDAAEPETRRMGVRIDAGERSRSRELTVTGNATLDEREIRAAADRLGIAAWMTPRLLADEIALIYRDRGLLRAAVTAGPVAIDAGRAVLPVLVEEGPQFTIGRITVQGTAQRQPAEIVADMGLAEGAPYAPADIDRARAAAAAGYARAGFNAATATIEPRIALDAATVDLDVAIEEGPRQVLQEIQVSGAEGVSPRVVAGALDLTPGTPVDLETWYAGRRRLSQTGLFRRIDLTPTPLAGAQAPGGVQFVRADVTLVRRQPWRLRYGVDVADEEAPIASQGRQFGGGLNANIERFGLFGGPGSASAALRYSRSQRSARGGVSWPSLFGASLASRLFLARSRDLVEGENILSFISDKTSITAEQRLTLGPGTLVAWAYQFERNHVFDPNADPDDPFAIDERWQQSRVTASLAFDTRSNPFDPVRGQFHSSNVEYGLEVLGRSGRFVTYSLQQLAFVPLPRGIVSASGVRLNVGRGFEGQDLIMTERFYVGGVNTVRGYPENALGGFDVFGDPIPGQAALVLNQEIRFPLFRWVRGVGFVDAGNVYPQAGDLSLGSLKVGTGAGLRFSTPLGLFRFDVATPLPKQDYSTQWYFAFGHIF